MNEEKKVPFKWEFGEETISLQLGMYANNQRLYIGMITHTEDGAEPFADMTVNLPGYSLEPGEAFISGDISKDLLRFIKENKLGKVLPYQQKGQESRENGTPVCAGKTQSVQRDGQKCRGGPHQAKGAGTMKKQFDIKKLVLLNLPYLLMGLFATNFGEAWRLAQGANASEKFLSLFAVLPGALQSFWPSLHPLDLLVGLCCGAGLRLAVYLKSKNAKKYRHGLEYGSARWGTREDIAPYIDPVFQNNVILTKTESLTMNSRPKDPKTARNKNVLVIGGSGSGKTRFWLKPNLMQMHSSYVITDPKGTILVECGKMLQRGAPKLGKDGKPMKDKQGKVIYEPYRIRMLNTINFKKSMHYNPFAYTVSAGHIYLDGIDVTEINEKQIARFRRENLGFVFQDFNLLDTLTISENIALALTINKVPAGEIDGRVREMAGKLNITDILDKYPYQVSGGQKQRCACARAIINQPKLILADEPTGALDSHSSQMLLSTIQSINEDLGATILMVTHDAFSASYANRILFLRDGTIFTEIRKGGDSRRTFFEKILDVLTMMGGGMNDVR